MTPCTRYEDDLALLAGGDLTADTRAAEVRASEALAHASACPACAQLLTELRVDQATFAQAAAAMAAPGGVAASAGFGAIAGLSASVIRRLEAMEAVGVDPSSAAHRVPARSLNWVTSAAAVAVLASTAGLILLMGRLQVEPSVDVVSGTGPAASSVQARVVSGAEFRRAAVAAAGLTESPGKEDEFRPVWVAKVPGEAVELTWSSDGREEKEEASTYKVLASASPRDFSSARPVEVAGNHLVAAIALPALRGTDRSVTYFRVQ